MNRLSNRFFESTLPTLEQAFLRPRFDRFMEFQTAASHVVSNFLRGKQDVTATLRLLDDLYHTWR